MPASFNGLSLGLIFKMATVANPTGRQINAYCGANGLEVINQGSRGGTTTVAGALSGYGASGLAAVEQSLRSMQVDGGAYVLVDQTGKAWSSVILVSFAPTGQIYPLVGFLPGTYGRMYEAQFLHLI